MTERISQEEKNRILFLHVVSLFKTAAYQHMGKLKNPVTDKIERDLEQARFSIDILDMLLAKTRGNLDDEERRYLERVIRELKLNYVDEVEKDRKAAESKKQGEEREEEKKAEEGSEPSGNEASEERQKPSSTQDGDQ